MARYNNRYSFYKNENENHKFYPFIKLREKETDKLITYKRGQTRLDKVSQQFYGDPFHEWVIMQANPEFGGLEFNIPDNRIIRIPYPLTETLREFQRKLNRQKRIYGY